MRSLATKQGLMLAYVGIALVMSCRPTDSVTISGRLLDGITGQPVLAFTMSVDLANGHTLKGKIKDGVYSVGPIPAYTDYTIRFVADGYRAYYMTVPANVNPAGVGNAARELNAIRDAYVFPTSVQTPATTVRVTLSNSAALPNGIIRLRPTAGASVFALDATANSPAPVGVGVGITSVPQLSNQADLLSALVNGTITNGVATFEAGTLVYGVTYVIDVLGVAGYGFDTAAATFVAGANDQPFVTLVPITAPGALNIVYTNIANDAIISNGSIVIGFSEPVELDPVTPKAALEEILDAAIGVRLRAPSQTAPDPRTVTCTPPAAMTVLPTSPGCGGTSGTPCVNPSTTCNPDDDGTDTILNVNSTSNNHGIGINLDSTGLTMTITWTEGTAFARRDTAGEVLTGVVWTGLSNITVRRVNRNGLGAATAITALPGSTAVTDPLTVQTAATPADVP